MFTPNKKKHFNCDCHWAAHGITFETDEGDYLDIYISNSRQDLSVWQRVKAAWGIIVGSDHALSEVTLDRSQTTEFVDYVCTLVHNEGDGMTEVTVKDMVYESETFVLHFRPNEEWKIFKEFPRQMHHELVFAVALMGTPVLPFDNIHSIHNHISVCIASLYPTKKSNGEFLWGWVHASPDAKKAIGLDLVSMDAIVNEWHYLVLDTRYKR